MDTVILVILMFVILVVVGGVVMKYTMDNQRADASLGLTDNYDHILNGKGVMKLLKNKNVKLNSPDNVLLPDILPALKPEILAKVSVKTLEDTATIVSYVIASMNLDLAHLQAMSPDQIMALSPAQLAVIDSQYAGPDNSFSALAPLVTPDQLKAVLAVFQKQSM